MKYRFAFTTLVLVLTGLASASGPHQHGTLPACEPGFRMVEEVTYQEVVRYVCKVVPDVKKKWVYSCIDDPFCIQHSVKACGNCNGVGCPTCDGPHCRKQLVKKQIDDPCLSTTKCVVEKIVDRVPCVTYRKVPCTEAAPVAPRRSGL